MSAAAKPKLDEQRLAALALDATKGALAFHHQILFALDQPVKVGELLRYAEDRAALIRGVDFTLLERAKHAIREIEGVLDPFVQVRDYSFPGVEYKTVRQVREFVDEVAALAEPLLALRRKKQ